MDHKPPSEITTILTELLLTLIKYHNTLNKGVTINTYRMYKKNCTLEKSCSMLRDAQSLRKFLINLRALRFSGISSTEII